MIKEKTIYYWSFVYDFISPKQSFRCKIVIRQVEGKAKEFASIMEIPQTKFKPPKKEGTKIDLVDAALNAASVNNFTSSTSSIL